MSDNTEIFIIEDGEKPRLDVFLAEQLSCTRSRVQKLCAEGHVLVNGARVKNGYNLRPADEVRVTLPEPAEYKALPENIPIEIIYEDDSIAVVNKPRNLSVHPANNIYTGTLVNALLFRLKNLSGINGEVRPGIVHRLDKNTTGLMVVAKTDAAHLALSRALAAREVKRVYTALLCGNLKADNGTVETYIGRDKKDRKKMAVCPAGEGRYAATDYKVIKRFKGYTLAEFSLRTGRTHQIRVHAKHLNCPVACDDAYGYAAEIKAEGQLLHAGCLSFIHPASGKKIEFTAPLPPDFKAALEILYKKEGEKSPY